MKSRRCHQIAKWLESMSVAIVGVIKRPRDDPHYEELRKRTNRKIHEELTKVKLESMREKKSDVYLV